MTDESGGAVEKSRQMYEGHSTLCYGVQCYAILRWCNGNNVSSKNINENGDYEWTMEAYDVNQRVRRCLYERWNRITEFPNIDDSGTSFRIAYFV